MSTFCVHSNLIRIRILYYHKISLFHIAIDQVDSVFSDTVDLYHICSLPIVHPLILQRDNMQLSVVTRNKGRLGNSYVCLRFQWTTKMLITLFGNLKAYFKAVLQITHGLFYAKYYSMHLQLLELFQKMLPTGHSQNLSRPQKWKTCKPLRKCSVHVCVFS